ncbi:2,5-diketo-D-gluconate reductase B [Halogranum gelatinilyticum]|uniref:2,5-diketo-D-gluconate reductase B n=1 Tax=Halogranum gelatinilyticum TaxID=660521 RepID=A0A1G9YK51_9EURY|nr:aldo/keto reductase [Halogranum gelatinilyticum]SDN09538.1 2,5-diketo-D-gluconate reductase B [Halogranum gelatinilyticum]
MTTLELPAIGYGTSGKEEGDVWTDSVAAALDAGYRHVDTAQMYENEAEVGAGIRQSSVDREDVILATKVHPDNLAADDAVRTANESLDRLGVEKVEMLYVHWPAKAYDAAETLSAFDELHDEGVMDYVCLSNFTPELLDEARSILDAPIAAHQVECHPLLPQDELRAYAKQHGHHLVGYSPLGRGEILDHPVLSDIASKHDVSTAQVCLAWAIEHDVVPIPKATGDHITDNLRASELQLDDEDLTAIDSIDERRRVIDPDIGPWNQS